MQVPAHLVQELLSTARYASSSLLLVQAAGGNNSVKDIQRDLLWVKTSGVRLADVTECHGTCALRMSELRHIVREGDREAESRAEKHERSVWRINEASLDLAQGRPSLETGFHAVLGDVVLHLHPVYFNAFACMEGGEALLGDVAPVPSTWVEYRAPGQELAAEVDLALQDKDVSSGVLCVALENHGFIASGPTAAEVIRATESFLAAGRMVFGELKPELFNPQPRPERLQQAAKRLRFLMHERWADEEYVIRPARFGAFDQFACNSQLWSDAGPLVPDDVVFAGKGISISALARLPDLVAAFGRAPQQVAVSIEAVGTILLARNEELVLAMEETLLAHILVRILVTRRGRVRTLPAEEVDYLQSMESEKYRIMVSSRSSG